MPKFFSTKYVLTKGIVKFEGEVISSTTRDGVEFASEIGDRSCYRRVETIGTDAFSTMDEAVASARKKILAKIRAVEKQKIKLEALLKEFS